MHHLRYKLDTINTILGESRNSVRAAISSGFLANKLQIPFDVRTVELIEEALKTGDVDLLISDVDLPGGDFIDLCRRIRNHELNVDPFLPIIAYGNIEPRRLNQILEAGVDHILIMPISIQALITRILGIIERRKGFVVTHDYVGPVRKSSQHEGVPILEAPNVIKAKATNDAKALLEAIEGQRKARQSISTHRIRAQAKQLVSGVQILEEMLRSGARAKADEQVEFLRRMTLEICERLDDTDYDHTRDLCHQTLHSLTKISDSETPIERDVALLKPLAMAINASFHDDEKTAGAARHIIELVNADAERRANAA